MITNIQELVGTIEERIADGEHIKIILSPKEATNIITDWELAIDEDLSELKIDIPEVKALLNRMQGKYMKLTGRLLV